MVSKTVKRMLGESSVGKPVIIKQRSVDYQVCPHCDEEIREKSLFSENMESPYMIHRSCGGKVLLPETDTSEIVSWLRPYVEKEIEKRRAYLDKESVS